MGVVRVSAPRHRAVSSPLPFFSDTHLTLVTGPRLTLILSTTEVIQLGFNHCRRSALPNLAITTPQQFPNRRHRALFHFSIFFCSQQRPAQR